MIDPDKKVEEAREKNAAIYNSQSHPKHFENEGSEFFERNEDMHSGMEIKEEAVVMSKEDSKLKGIKFGNGLSTGEGEEAGDFMGTGKMREAKKENKRPMQQAKDKSKDY